MLVVGLRYPSQGAGDVDELLGVHEPRRLPRRGRPRDSNALGRNVGERACRRFGVARAVRDRRARSPTRRARVGGCRSLDSTEELTLWILLAHELDPSSRQLIRELNTEKVVDATLDSLRRCVFTGTHRSRSNVELSTGGALQRFRLIERTDDNTRCPEHRQTLGVSKRVLALALGSLELDPAVADFASLSANGLLRDELVIDERAMRTLDHLMRNPSGLTLVIGKPGTRFTSGMQARKP